MLEEGRRFGPGEGVSLAIERAYPRGDQGFPPGGYLLRIGLNGGRVVVGTMILRVFPDPRIESFVGHLGYEIEPDYRGRGFAAAGVRLLGPLAQHHGLETLWVMVSPDNLASCRTMERVGAEHADTVEVPPDSDLRGLGVSRVRRYRFVPGR